MKAVLFRRALTVAVSIIFFLSLVGVGSRADRLPVKTSGVDRFNFGGASNFGVGTSPVGVAVADFNLDGRPDMVVANSSSSNVSVLLGNGAGSFGTATNFAAGSSCTGVAVGDFNLDGRPDVAVTNNSFTTGTVSVLLGNGAGGLGTATAFAVGQAPRSVVVGDFNLDGRPDLAVANVNTNNVSVLLGNGAGAFGAATNFGVGNSPRSIAVGDFNLDGKLDLATANNSGNSLSILLGNGAGSFAAATTVALGASPAGVSVGDFNLDGKPDLAIANNAASSVSVVLGDGAGAFGTPATFSTASGPQSVTVGDFNLDGKPDLAAPNFSAGTLSVLFGNGAGAFGTATNFTVGSIPQVVTVGDFNLDGKSDLAVTNQGSGNVSVLLNQAPQAPCTGTSFGATANFGVASSPQSVAVGDFNLDGKLDLAAANNIASNNVSVLLGNGAGSFGTATFFGAGSQAVGVAVGDFNLDGKPDLVTANLASANISLLLGNGAGSFGTPSNFTVGTQPFALAVGDFNLDGKPDLAVANNSSGTVTVLPGTGGGSFGTATTLTVGTNPRSLVVGDFNQDGKPDLAVANFFTNNVSVLLGNGAGAFGAATNFAVGTRPQSVAVGDFNQDGKADLATANSSGNSVSVLLGNGAGSFGAASSFTVGTSPFSVVVGDFNRDGKADLAAANGSSGNVSVLLGDGAGSFAAATNFGVGTSPQLVVTGDFNQDGKSDLAVANAGSSNVSVLLNSCCPVITGTVSGSTTVCPGVGATVTVTVTGGVAPYSVTLSNGGGTQTGSGPLSFPVTPGSTTTYTVQSGTDANGCPITGSGSATVTVSPTPAAFNVTGGGSFCIGGSGVPVGLSGSETGVNYQLFFAASPVGSPVAGTGSAISFGNQTNPGTYTVVATNATTNCTANMTGSATVNVNPTPTVFNVTGGGSFCTGGTGVAVGLSGSQTGVNYQLFNGASPVGSPVAGTGSALNFGNQSTAGTYTVVATNATTGCTSNMNGNAVVTVISLVVTNGNDSGAGSLRDVLANACAGSTITFQAGVTTVTLTSAELTIGTSVTIDGGPGVTVTRQGGSPNFRIFNVLSGNTVSMNNLTVTNGSAPVQAGGIQNSGTLTLTNCTISGNTAPQGGGVQNDDTLTMTGCVVSNNSASGGGGGGIAIFGASTTVTDCEISGNTATGGGGGILYGGTLLTLNNCTISGNTTTGLTGGGIFNGGSSNLTNCTISGNAATGTSSGGGGMSNSGSSTLTNCTMSGNTASLNGGGILIFNNATGPTTLRNTIVAQNTASNSANIFGTVNAASFNNLIGVGGTGGLANGVNGNLVGVATPLLAALGSNGGPTQTIGLLPGSPAINAGTATSAPTTDQRGISRVGNVDIGAFESRGFTLAVASGDNQIANVTTAFASPLAVTVSSSFSEPVNGGRITFTPPGSGASAGIAGNPATIASGTATTGTVTANGTPGGPYTVAASANGVTTGANFSLTNACPTITAFNVTGGGSFCAGGTGVAVGLSGSQTGVNYRLFNGASPVGGSVAGTGSALNFGNQTTAGTYTVVGTFGSTSCTANMTGSAVVTVNPTPSIFNVTGGGSFCAGGSGVAVGLSGSETGVNYQLFNGASPVGSPVAGTGSALNFGNQTTGGTYTVVATATTGSCTSNMTGSAVVTVNPTPSIFNVTGGGSFCTGGTGVAVGLSGSQTGVNYQLFNGASPVGSPVAGTSSALSFGNQTTAGTYTVVATNGTTGCTSNMSGSAVVTVTTCQPTVTTNPATGVSSTGATLNGTVNANGDSTTVLFRFGTTAGGPYPNLIAATPSPVTGTTPTAVSAVLTGLTPNQIYYFIIEGTNGSGTTQGTEQSFSTATCSFSLSASSANFPASGGNGSVTLTTTAGCAWTVSGIPTWISNLTPANGTGTTTITYTVNPNYSETPRTATLTIGGQSYTVNQDPSVPVNSSIGLAITGQTVLPTSCAPNYANDYVITATLTNTGTQTIYNPYLRVLELQEAAGSPAPPVPFRLLTADGATCGSGGLIGSIQSTDGQTTPATLPTLAPGQSVTVRLVIALPSLRRFRFVFGVDGGFVAPVAMKNAKANFARTFTLARQTEPSTGTSFVFIPNADGKTMNIVPVQPELEAFLNLGDDFWADLNRTLTSGRQSKR